MIERRKKRELLGISIAFGSTIILLSLLSYSPSDPTLFGFSPSRLETRNWMGLFGSHLARLLYTPFGIASFILPIILFRLAWDIFWERKLKVAFYTLVPILGISSASILLSLFAKEIHLRGEKISGGGLVGEWITNRMIEIFSYTGTIIIVIGVGLCVVVAFLPWSLLEISRSCKAIADSIFKQLSKLISYISRTVVNTMSAISFKKDHKPSLVKNGKNSTANRAKPLAPPTSPLPSPPPPTELDKDMSIDDLFASSIEEPAPSISKNRSPEPVRRSEKEKPSSSPPYPYIFNLPSIELLDKYETHQDYEDIKVLQKKAQVLTQKLADFGVHGEVVNILPGPVITMFEYVPAPGIKISRIVNLQSDLTMALKALSIRIVAPIPGKAAVGIEIPNAKRQLVSIRSVIESPEFKEATAPLTIALGKDTTGNPVVTNLAKMPHLLIAGATGTGKSVCLNSILASLLFRNTPHTLRLLLIDPKRIELSLYEGIPHLIHPVVTDVKKATKALQWAVAEMEHRYELMAQFNARNIEGYNKKVSEGQRSPEEEDYKPLPYLVVIIDELADLMMVASREVEEHITRLAQMARAAGIHLVLATQRPSVDVITGLIKANIPSRISFQVSSKIDSRTILDAPGAETLLGSGDMLFLPPGTAKLQRIHGAFISDREVQRITEFWREEARKAGWETEHIDLTEDTSSGEINEEDVDEKYEEAVKLVLETRQASISMLQRRLRVGYNRAARMIELMEKQGIVGPSDGIKPREVLGPPRNS